MRTSTYAIHILLILSIILISCAGPVAKVTTPSQATEVPVPSGPASVGTSLLIVPPTVVAVTPERGAEHSTTEPVVVFFDQPMDPSATTSAFAISPHVEGKIEVDGNQLLFMPDQPLAYAARYEITISQQARSQRGKSLLESYVHQFSTVGFLSVSSTQPGDGAEGVAVDGTVTVVFNRPVVPLLVADQSANLPDPLVFEPAVQGKGSWLNTSVYKFHPDAVFAASTRYKVAVTAGLRDTTGSILPEDVVFTFRTADPAVVKKQPQGGQVPPTAPITVTFSQPMNRVSVETAFLLTPAVAGSFQWSDDDRTFTFVPDEWLPYNALFVVKVADTARPAEGEGALREETTWNFHTVALPRVVRTTPADGEQGASPNGGLEIFFASPIDPGTITDEAVTIIPKPTTVYTFWSRYDNRLFVGFNKQPATTYNVILDDSIGDAYGNTLEESVVIRFTTRDLTPQVSLSQSVTVGTYNSYTNTVILVNHVNVSRVDATLYRIDEATFAHVMGDGGYKARQEFQPNESDLVERWEVPVDTPRNQSGQQPIVLRDSEGNRLSPGLYYINITSQEVEASSRQGRDIFERGTLLVVSNLNLTLKHTVDETLVWATDLQSGRPVADLPVRVIGTASTLGEGSTGDDGVFHSRHDRQEPWRPLFVFAGSGDTFSAVMNRWDTGIGPWEFGISSQMYGSEFSTYLYTDRPIYRPGQTVYWKAALRADDDARYSLPDLTQPVQMEVRNDRGQSIITETLTLNDFSTVNGEFTLDSEADLGTYSIILRLPEHDVSFGRGFQVAEYRKPELELTVRTDRPEYIQGDTVTLSAQAQYFFGGPVKEAEVRWTVLSNDYYFSWQPEGERRHYDFTDDALDVFRFERFGETVSSGVGMTDDEGRFTVQLPADVGKRLVSQRWTLEVAVTDVNNQEVAGQTTAVIHRGEYYIGLSPRRYVGAVDVEQEVDVVAVDTEGSLLPDTSVTIVVSERKWFSVKEKAENGRFYWVSKPQDTPIITRTLTTDSEGLAILHFTPEGGGVIAITASGRDARGNEIRTTTLLWVSARSGRYVNWRRENNDRIEIVADKKEYRVGETAEILIPSPYEGEVHALLTLERGGILSHQLLRLSSNSETVKIPILPEYAPNVFVSLLLVKGMDGANPAPSFKMGIVELPVSVEQKELDITLVTSETKVGPRQTVTYTVEARDHSDQPVDAEVSLALVDKAIFSLAGPQQGTMLDQFYRQRGLGVATSTVLAVSLDRLNQQLAEGAKGGGGGGGGGVPFVRQEFPDTAFWNPVVRTGSDGRAQVSVTLPDNLTTWRMTAKALTVDTLVGEAENDVVASLDLLVRPVTPRFFVDGDQAEIAAVVHNNTDEVLSVHVDLTAGGLMLKDVAARDVTVAAGGLHKVVWLVEVIPGEDEVTLLFSATSGGLSDAVRLTLPVHHYVAQDTAATAGEVTAADQQRLELIGLPMQIDPTQGELRVRIEPSLAAGLRAGLKHLTYYEYDSTEMVLSRFLPNVVTYQAVKQFGGPMPHSLREMDLSSLVSEGVQRLYRLQNPDGGWGWWGGERSQPFLSAYVIYGLAKAQQAGFMVDETVMERAQAYVTRQLMAPNDFKANYEVNQQAFILYALAEAGQMELSRAVKLYDYRERLSVYGQAFLAMTLGLAEPDEPTRVNTLLDDLIGQVVISATGRHWEEAWVDRWNMNTDVRTTAIVLDALARLRPQDPLIPNVVRWLMAVRNGKGYWPTTQESVWSIIGLTDWMVASGELDADYAWRVLLNDQKFGQGVVDASNLDEVVELKAVVAGLLREQANALLLERLPLTDQANRGRLYYTAHLRVFRPVETVEAISRGIFISRQYALADAPEQSIESAKVGDIIQVKLTIIAPTDLSYVVVEDPFPAGTEAVDVRLDTTSIQLEKPELTRDVPEPTYWWNTWVPSHTALRDEKAVLFATYLPRGTYEYTYLLRAGLPGEFRVIPATASESYFPEVYGRTNGMLFTITE